MFADRRTIPRQFKEHLAPSLAASVVDTDRHSWQQADLEPYRRGANDFTFPEGALTLHVRFWGTRGSIAKPGPRTIRYGGNTSCVEVRSAAGTLVVIDCGTGAHGLGKLLMESEPRPL